MTIEPDKAGVVDTVRVASGRPSLVLTERHSPVSADAFAGGVCPETKADPIIVIKRAAATFFMSFAWVNYIWLTDEDFNKQVAERRAQQSRTPTGQQ